MFAYKPHGLRGTVSVYRLSVMSDSDPVPGTENIDGLQRRLRESEAEVARLNRAVESLRADARKGQTAPGDAGSLDKEQELAAEQARAYTTALELANRTLEEYSFQALAATRAKSEFLANMSHEIRTPIMAIMGFAEAILTDGDISRAPPQRIEAIDAILRNSRFLLELVDDILDLSKIEAGRLDVEDIACSPVTVLNDVIRLVQSKADAKGVSLTAEYKSPIPEAIRTDPTRLRQILLNLVGNAVKFTESGGLVRAQVELARDGQGSCLRFNIIDTGIGIAPQQMSRLFQPFTQADSSTTRRFGGTGLGLAISRRLSEILGGGITAESELGKGSTFRLTIAVGSLDGVKLLDDPREPAPTEPLVEKVSRLAEVRLSGCILVADDAPDNRRLISLFLTKAGAEVVTAENGKQAYEAALDRWRAGNPFDLIVMDMQMPVLDGYHATKMLRAAGYPGSVVALTANAMSGERAKCLAVGCNDYATKPIERAVLLRTIAENLPHPVSPGHS